MDHAVLEMHGHEISTTSDRTGFYCRFVYLDGVQCSDIWAHYPQVPGWGSRVMDPEKVRAWQRMGGPVDDRVLERAGD